jgi:hypothetical protein
MFRDALANAESAPRLLDIAQIAAEQIQAQPQTEPI